MNRGLRSGVVVVVHLLGALVGGCATFGTSPEGRDGPAAFLARGSTALERGRFGQAYRALRALAIRCGSGDEGREAVLLLATVELDPRNPARLAPAGAQLAARYLQSPSLSVTSRGVAESLYLLALDLGAPPVVDPFARIPVIPGVTGTDTEEEATDPADRSTDVAPELDADGAEPPEEAWSVAPRFRDCSSPAPPVVVRDLPGLTGPSLDATVESLVDQRETLRSRVDSLSAELERVRGLLRSDPPAPDTARDGP